MQCNITDRAPVSKGLMGALFITCTAINVPLMSHLRMYLICQLPNAFTSGEVYALSVVAMCRGNFPLQSILFNRCGGYLHHKQHFLKQKILYVELYWYITSGGFLFHRENFFLYLILKFGLDRIFERRLGSKKFASYLLATSLSSLMLQVPVILLIRSTGWGSYHHHGHLPPGP